MKFLEKYSDLIKDKKIKILFIAVLVGILLITVSNTFSDKKQTDTVNKTSGITTEEYIKNTEEKLSNALSDMLNDNKVSVMITVDNGIEYVYASENKNDNDIVENENSGDAQKTKQSEKKENTYKTIKDNNGNETPLIVSEIMPQIRGVFVVCENGNQQSVQNAVKSAVQTTLSIDSEKIYVSGKY